MKFVLSDHTAKEVFKNRPANDRRQPLNNSYQQPQLSVTPQPKQASAAIHKRPEYRVIEGPNGIAELEMKVNDMLDQGWKLMGGISFDRGCAYQAMARVTTDPMEPTVPPPTLTE